MSNMEQFTGFTNLTSLMTCVPFTCHTAGVFPLQDGL